MPRNATRQGAKKRKDILEQFPEKIYADLPLEKQIACYKFWSYLEFEGAQGWSPSHTPGSIKNYRLSKTIYTRIKPSSWPKIGKVSKQRREAMTMNDAAANYTSLTLFRLWQHLRHTLKQKEKLLKTHC